MIRYEVILIDLNNETETVIAQFMEDELEDARALFAEKEIPEPGLYLQLVDTWEQRELFYRIYEQKE